MSGWQLNGDAPTSYSRFILKFMEGWTDDLILSAHCRDGDRVLDVACGTGIVANRVNSVSRRLCTITGIDLNEGMLTVARTNPQIEWRQGSASELPFEESEFDVVLCQQGLQYFPDRSAAMREMARVLAPGGRLAVSVWGALERQSFQAALADGVVTFLGPDAGVAFELASSLSSVEELRHLAENAGLPDARVRIEHRTLRYPIPARMVSGFMGATPVTAQFLAMSDDRKQAFVDHVVKRLASYIDDAGLAALQENHILTASKPG